MAGRSRTRRSNPTSPGGARRDCAKRTKLVCEAGRAIMRVFGTAKLHEKAHVPDVIGHEDFFLLTALRQGAQEAEARVTEPFGSTRRIRGERRAPRLPPGALF